MHIYHYLDSLDLDSVLKMKVTESYFQFISIISFSGLAFNVQLGVLTLTIAEHSNGKRIQRHSAPCSRVMDCVEITILMTT